MSHSEGSPERVWALMEKIGVAMVVTHDGEADHLRARPMAARPDAAAHAIYFLTDAAAGKDDEVAHNANVCLAFADLKGQKYVSVTGMAHMSNDRARIKQVWSVADKTFWKDAEDPAIRLLTVQPLMAEYWDGPGLAVSLVKMIGAGLMGGDRDFGESKKVALS